MDKDARKCYRCNGEGHIARNCPNKPPPRACFACGATGHLRRQCPTLADSKKPPRTDGARGRPQVGSGSEGLGAVGGKPRVVKKHAVSSPRDETKLVAELAGSKDEITEKVAKMSILPSATEVEEKLSAECVSMNISPPTVSGQPKPTAHTAASCPGSLRPPIEGTPAAYSPQGSLSFPHSATVQPDRSAHHEERPGKRDKIAPPWASVPFIDTHCHLEYILQRYSYHGSFGAFTEEYGYPDIFEGCISTFCDAAAFSPSLGMWEELLSVDGVWGTFGMHPHNAKYYSDQVEDRMLECLKHPKCVALGEVGLDYAKHSPSDEQTQKQVLVQQLGLAVVLGKPLLLHCRNAEEDLLETLSSHVPSDWKIHLHCFTGGLEMSQRFLSEFSNLYIGITGNVTFAKAHNVKQVAREIPLERLLLETDSPYNTPENLPRHLRCRHNHPALVLYIAKEIAKLRQISVDDVLRASRSNTRTLYGV